MSEFSRLIDRAPQRRSLSSRMEPECFSNAEIHRRRIAVPLSLLVGEVEAQL